MKFCRTQVNKLSDEQLLEDFGGAQGTDSGIVEAVVTDDQIQHAIAFLAVETKDAHVTECHA